MSRKITTKEYKAVLKTIMPHIKVLVEYTNAKTEILHKCIKHKIVWDAKPYRSNAFTVRLGCPKCIAEHRSKITAKTMQDKHPSKLTNSEYKKRLKVICST